ncbi:Protein kinase domain-containing protein, cytoplasmic [Aphelenchoides fujianensis]|nr:Protein kinase domain-containing protein, cytoplasmic [Aphelenchoides fujianensis]
MKKNRKWSLLFGNAFCSLLLLFFLFAVTLLSSSDRQRELLYRRARSMIDHPQRRAVRDFLPPISLVGSEWRFPPPDGQPVGDCAEIPAVSQEDAIVAEGFSKRVHRFGRVVIKRPLLREGRAFRECVGRGQNETACLDNEVNGFLVEIGLLLRFRGDPNVPKIFAYCIPHSFANGSESLAIVVEGGEPVDLLGFLALDWRKRVDFVREVLFFLRRAQPVNFGDFRRQQFVVGENGRPMFVDFDDVSIGSNGTENSDSQNAARKVFEEFGDQFLWIGRPPGGAPTLERIRDHFQRQTLDLENFSQLVDELKAGN